MNALAGFEPAHNGKRMDLFLATSIPIQLSKLTTNTFSGLLTMLSKCFDFKVYKQGNVNIAIKSWTSYIIDHSAFWHQLVSEKNRGNNKQ